MQKCGQLHASIAVALMAQSAAGEAVWPADTPSRAITISNGTLRIRVTSFSCGIIYAKNGFRKANRDTIEIEEPAIREATGRTCVPESVITHNAALPWDRPWPPGK